MSRKFTKNTSNYASLGNGALGPYLAGAAQLSVSAWGLPASLTTVTSDNCILGVASLAANVILLNVGGSAPTTVRFISRSLSTDSVTNITAIGATSVTTGKWWHLGAWADFAAAHSQCILNGVADGSLQTPPYGQGTFGYTAATKPDGFSFLPSSGPPATTGQQWDGWLADVAIWRAKLNTAEWAALGRGASPGSIRPSSLVAWWPMLHPGNQLPDVGPFRRHAPVTGSVPAAPDPPRPGRPLIIPARRAREAFAPTSGLGFWIYGDQCNESGV